MRFIKTSSPASGTKALLDRMRLVLRSGNKALWLLSGGSAIASEAAILKSLQNAEEARNLTIMLMDERYGAVGHENSNWEQLKQAGCDFTSFDAIPVLDGQLKSMDQTAREYTEKLKSALNKVDIVIGLFGIGPDGHTAGILPDSPATNEIEATVICYSTPQFDRITLTRAAFKRVNVGYVFAYGDAKAPALEALRSGQKTFRELPSLLLEEIPEVYVYNDQIGEPG